MKRETNSPQVLPAAESAKEDRLLTTAEAAEFLSVTQNALKWWRTRKHRGGPPFIRVARFRRYCLADLRGWISERTVRPERLTAPFYGQLRIEKLGEKHPGLLEFVEQEMHRHRQYARIAAVVLERWGERIPIHSLHNYYCGRVWPKILDEQRSQVSSR